MLTLPSPHAASQKMDSSVQSIKLLTQRESYTNCRIYIPDEADRMPAISVESKFYGFFRALSDPAQTLRWLFKLTQRGDQVAVTSTKKRYVIWVYEPDGSLVKSNAKKAPNTITPAFGPADCWVIHDKQPGYRVCSLKVPDLPDTISGIAQGQKLYSLYRRENDAANTFKLAARLCQRGDEVVIVVSSASYAICISEPGATIIA
ncbi:MAG: hypothetical protein F6K42_25470 [Leptolyngbya sp. SIO1D8]|nr:hypothetical protein [Leptolyngbya sp. SIO1D8]